MILAILKMIGCLALLMFGMKTMSEGLQKLTGGHLRTVLGTMTKHRVGGLLTGTFVTAAVQSSTATTVMTVSFVNAGLLTLKQAIPVIMGANIGTTATAWIMSIFGFQFNMSSVVWPFFGLGIVLTYVRKNSVKSFGEFVFGFAFMFLGLTTLRLRRSAKTPWRWICRTTRRLSTSLPRRVAGAFSVRFCSSCSAASSRCACSLRQPSWPLRLSFAVAACSRFTRALHL